MIAAIDMGDYYRVPPDLRTLIMENMLSKVIAEYLK